MLRLLRTCTCPRFRKTRSLFQQAAHQALARAFTWDLRFTPPLCDYSRSPSTWDLQFSSASQLGASTRMVCVQNLGLCSERESQVLRSFLLLPQCVLDLKSVLSESIKPDFLGRTKSFPALLFLVAMLLRCFRLSLSCF